MLLVRPLGQIDIVVNANVTSRTLDNSDNNDDDIQRQWPRPLLSVKIPFNSRKFKNNLDALGKRLDEMKTKRM